MRKTITIALALLAVATIALAGGGNILASGEIEIAACTAGSTNTQTVGLYNITGKEWGQVYAIVVKNNTDFPTVTTVSRTDLDDTTTLVSATATSGTTTYAAATLYGSTANSVKVYSGTNDVAVFTNTVTTYYPIPPPCAKELLVSVAITTNDAASTLEYLIYGE